MSKRLSSAEFDQQVLDTLNTTKKLTLSGPLPDHASSSSRSLTTSLDEDHRNSLLEQSREQERNDQTEQPDQRTETLGRAALGNRSSASGTAADRDTEARHEEEERRLNSKTNSGSRTRASSLKAQQNTHADHSGPGSSAFPSSSAAEPAMDDSMSSSAGDAALRTKSTTIQGGPEAQSSTSPPSAPENASTFSKTMRKTSGFFRKTFGASSSPQQQQQRGSGNRSLYSTSNRSTPSHSATLRGKGSSAPVPPVPSLPSKEGLNALDRRRSTSVSHVPNSQSQRRHGAQSNLKNNSSSSRDSSTEGGKSKSDEDERLNRVLKSVDWDGLAAKLNRSPSPQPSAALPPPTTSIDTVRADPRAGSTSRQSSSDTVTKPPGQNPPRSTRSSSLPSSASLPLQRSSSLEPRRASAQAEAPSTQSTVLSPATSPTDENAAVHAAPSIRLVPSHPSPSSSPSNRNESSLPTATSSDREQEERSNQPQEAAASPTSPTATGPALGLSLDPISEDAQSKESLLSDLTTRPGLRRTHSSDSSTHQSSSSKSGIPDSIAVSPVRPPSTHRHSLGLSGLAPARASTSSLARSFTAPSHTLTSEEALSRGLEAGQKCWDEDESFIKKHKIAELLGSGDALGEAARKQYMSNFDLSGLRLDLAFRKLCDKLYLKAETQQVDRILEQFSRKYYEDNPECVLSSPDVVHQVVYSILLLNTDLHVADVSSHMSSKQFVRNTMSTIQAHSPAASPQHSSPQLPQITRIKSSEPIVASPVSSPIEEVDESTATRPQLENARERVSSNTLSGRLQRTGSIASHHTAEAPHASPVRSKSTPITASKIWDNQIETLLRDIYADIKNNPVYLPGVSTTNLGVGSASLRNAANRRSQISLAGGSVGLSGSAAKRASMRGFLSHPSTDSVRASSPTQSTITSFSDGTSTALGSSTLTTATSLMAAPQPTIGFASNLSNTIIKEHHEHEDADDSKMEAESDSGISTTDEELALMGAPWAKEGLLQRKHYWESQNRRAKDKNWGQVFVVISKGDFRMFKFGDTSKGSSRSAAGFGGGNWLANAEDMGDISLAHSLTCAMPPPGYSSSRRYVFVLTLASNSSYFFQAGTDELVQEWVSTCNYWAARLSREPLTGGVSNMEFGWNRVLPSISPAARASADEDGEEELDDARSVRSGKSNKSGRSARSGRSRFSSRNHHPLGHFAASGTSSNGSASNSNDRVVISEWKPPQQPTTGSTLSEEEQLKSLRRYCQVLQSDLEAHNELRGPMTRLYSAKSPNASKSAANWEKKSSFLLSEIVKYTTYISALEEAIRLRSETSAKKAMDKMLKAADDDGDDGEGDAMESLAALEGDRKEGRVGIHQGRAEVGSFVDVTAPAPLMGDAPLAGIRKHKRASTQSSISYLESEYHDSQSLAAQTQSSLPSTSDQFSPRQSMDTTY